MVYTVDEIKKKIVPVASKHGIAAVYLFGSYARGEATENSDIDIAIDRDGSDIKSAFDMGGLFSEIEEQFGTDKVDLITTNQIKSPRNTSHSKRFSTIVLREMVKIYEQ